MAVELGDEHTSLAAVRPRDARLSLALQAAQAKRQQQSLDHEEMSLEKLCEADAEEPAAEPVPDETTHGGCDGSEPRDVLAARQRRHSQTGSPNRRRQVVSSGMVTDISVAPTAVLSLGKATAEAGTDAVPYQAALGARQLRSRAAQSMVDRVLLERAEKLLSKEVEECWDQMAGILRGDADDDDDDDDDEGASPLVRGGAARAGKPHGGAREGARKGGAPLQQPMATEDASREPSDPTAPADASDSRFGVDAGGGDDDDHADVERGWDVAPGGGGLAEGGCSSGALADGGSGSHTGSSSSSSSRSSSSSMRHAAREEGCTRERADAPCRTVAASGLEAAAAFAAGDRLLRSMLPSTAEAAVQVDAAAFASERRFDSPASSPPPVQWRSGGAVLQPRGSGSAPAAGPRPSLARDVASPCSVESLARLRSQPARPSQLASQAMPRSEESMPRRAAAASAVSALVGRESCAVELPRRHAPREEEMGVSLPVEAVEALAAAWERLKALAVNSATSGEWQPCAELQEVLRLLGGRGDPSEGARMRRTHGGAPEQRWHVVSPKDSRPQPVERKTTSFCFNHALQADDSPPCVAKAAFPTGRRTKRTSTIPSIAPAEKSKTESCTTKTDGMFPSQLLPGAVDQPRALPKSPALRAGKSLGSRRPAEDAASSARGANASTLDELPPLKTMPTSQETPFGSLTSQDAASSARGAKASTLDELPPLKTLFGGLPSQVSPNTARVRMAPL